MKRTLSTILTVIFMISVILSGCSSSHETDYSNKENWVYAETNVDNKAADVFFICPTVYAGSDNCFNMQLDDTVTKADFLGATNMERGIYDTDARFFAPYYRQVGLNVYKMSVDEREQYLSLAFEDVKASFEYYLEHYNNGRPIILAGFSQGADMCIRLLKNCFSDESLQERLVACYAIGWSVSQQEIDEYPALKFATGESDTGVVIAFISEAVFVEDSLMVPQGSKTLAINPLNWKNDSTSADKSENLGACFTDYAGNIVPEIPCLTGCYIDSTRGTLKITDVSPDDYPAGLDIFTYGIYHLYDYQFFYKNLQKNVITRLNAWSSTVKNAG